MRDGEIGHVERAGDAVDQADADQKQQRCRKVDHDVMQPGLDARRSRAVQRKAVRSREQDLEENEKVEQIAGEKRAIEPHQQELKQGMEKHAHAVPASQREYDRGRREETGQQQHECGQPVQPRARSRTAPASRPDGTRPPRPVGAASAARSSAIAIADEREGGRNIERGVDVAVTLAAEQRASPRRRAAAAPLARSSDGR